MLRAPLLPALFAASLVLGGCAPLALTPARTPALEFGGPAPDVVIFAVSGRCGVACAAPRDNWDYLTARGTADVVAAEMLAAGYRVQVAGYASSASESFTSALTATGQRGYAALAADYARLGTAWTGADRPRVVLLGHSQGVAWLHHLARAYPEQPVALQIDLDGICAAWHSDHGASLRGRPHGAPAQSASAQSDSARGPARPPPAEACNLFRVAGRALRGKDIVWPNVARNLEVQSGRLNYLFEVTPNARPDGSRTGLERYVSRREDHRAVSLPRSAALRWVVSRTAGIVQDWKREDAARLD